MVFTGHGDARALGLRAQAAAFMVLQTSSPSVLLTPVGEEGTA
jgi:hypothetical protein